MNKAEIEKGCGDYYTRGAYTFTCGKSSLKGNIQLCPICKAKLSQRIDDEKEFKDVIEHLKRKCWTTNQGSIVISFCDLEELLSKIGDNSKEVKE